MPWSDSSQILLTSSKVCTYFQTGHLEDQFPLRGLNSGTPCRWEIILKLYCYSCPYSAHYWWPPQGLATARDWTAAVSDSTTICMSLFDTFLLFVKINQTPNIYHCLTKAEDHKMPASVGAKSSSWNLGSQSERQGDIGQKNPQARLLHGLGGWGWWWHCSSRLTIYSLQAQDLWVNANNK